MTTMSSSDMVDDLADRRASQPPVQRNQSEQILSNCYAEYSPHQKFIIQKQRLEFLRKCLTLKRPPPSLRITGASAIQESEKLRQFSILETEMLQIAIKNKLNEIRELKTTAETSRDVLQLKDSDVKSLKTHFTKKLSFYKSQNEEKWSNWPHKPSTQTSWRQIFIDIRTSRKKWAFIKTELRQ